MRHPSNSACDGIYHREGTPRFDVLINGSPSFVRAGEEGADDFYIRKSSRFEFSGTWTVLSGKQLSMETEEFDSIHGASVVEMREFLRDEIIYEFWEMIEVGLTHASIGKDFLHTTSLVVECLAHHKCLWFEQYMSRLLSPQDYHKLLVSSSK